MFGQVSPSKFYNNSNLRNKHTQKNYNPPHFYLPTREKFAPPYISPDLAQNLLSDRSWAPLLYMSWAVGRPITTCFLLFVFLNTCGDKCRLQKCTCKQDFGTKQEPRGLPQAHHYTRSHMEFAVKSFNFFLIFTPIFWHWADEVWYSSKVDIQTHAALNRK